MSLHATGSFTRMGAVILILAAAAAVAAPAAWAQSSSGEPIPTVEVFVGYAWMNPGATILGTTLDSMPKGGTTSVTYDIGDHWGMTADFGGYHDGNNTVGTIMGGPQYKWRGERISPYLHGLVGLHLLALEGAPTSTGIGLGAGGGLDLHISRHIDWRMIQADYIYAHQNPRPTVLGSPMSVPTNLHGARVATGLVFKLGGGPPPPPASCSVSVSPAEVMAGEAVSANASAANFPKNHALTYTWSASGGKASGTGTSGSVDTTGLAPGSYSVSVQASDGKKATASCSGAFTIKEPPKHPPQLSCSANPATVRSGEPSTISCSCTSPDNRSLSYSWNASAGQVSGSGASATLDTAGVPSGPVNVRTTCTDDRGLSDATTTAVNVEAPPPVPQASKLNECEFPNRAKPGRVDNKCKAVLDDVALRLQRDADAKLVIVGQSDTKEAGGKKLAAQRATNSKAYLAQEKGIDPGRMEARTRMGGGKRAEYWIVPAGATFSEPGTEVVMEKAAMMKKAPMKKKAGK